MLKRFEFDKDGCIDYTPLGDCVDYEEANELLLEAYQAIVDNCAEEQCGYYYCLHCDKSAPDNQRDIEHKDDCIVLKAEKYIEEVTK